MNKLRTEIIKILKSIQEIWIDITNELFDPLYQMISTDEFNNYAKSLVDNLREGYSLLYLELDMHVRNFMGLTEEEIKRNESQSELVFQHQVIEMYLAGDNLPWTLVSEEME